MNNVQQQTFAYLTDPDGSSARADGLRLLTERGFFTQTTPERSREELREFIEEHRGGGRFCSEGLGRFAENILGTDIVNSGPRTDRLSVSIDLTLTHSFGSPDAGGEDDMSEIIHHKVAAALNLLRGGEGDQAWNISDTHVESWYTI